MCIRTQKLNCRRLTSKRFKNVFSISWLSSLSLYIIHINAHNMWGIYIYIFANFCKKLSSKVKKATLSAWHSRALKLHWCFMLQWTCSTKSCLVLVYLVEDFLWILILNQKLTSPNSYFPFCRAVFKYYILLTFQSPR